MYFFPRVYLEMPMEHRFRAILKRQIIAFTSSYLNILKQFLYNLNNNTITIVGATEPLLFVQNKLIAFYMF